MFKFLGILCFLLTLVSLIITINPKWIAREGKEPMKRKYTLLAALVTFALFFTFVINSDNSDAKSVTSSYVTEPAKAEPVKITDSDKALLIMSQYKLFTEDDSKHFAEIEDKYFNHLKDAEKAEVKADFERLYAQKQYHTWIKAQFSVWDGSNTQLVDLNKKNLNDPKSFDHEKTTYSDKGDHLIIKMTYRAKNSFGALILQNVTAKVDYKTQAIEIISQNN